MSMNFCETIKWIKSFLLNLLKLSVDPKSQESDLILNSSNKESITGLLWLKINNHL